MNVTFVSKTKVALTFAVSIGLALGVNYLLNVPTYLTWITGFVAGWLTMTVCRAWGWIR